MSAYSERKWIKQGKEPEAGWQETGRTMSNGAGQQLIEIGKPVTTKSSKKQDAEPELTESTE